MPGRRRDARSGCAPFVSMLEAAYLQSATCPTRPTSPTSRNGDDGAIAGRHDRTANWRVLVKAK
jgi:hypothetical protein